MAKKFFYNRVYNTKRTIINAIIIGVCIIGVIICFIIVSNFEGEDHSNLNKNLSIKDVTIELNEKITKEMFFSKIENVNIDDIKINYPLDYDISKIGDYVVTIIVSGKEYQANLKVVDTTKPELIIKNINIEKNDSYSAKDFVSSCTDNSKKECKIVFYEDGIDVDGNKIDYSKYNDEGKYQIKISASDDSGNLTVKEATLTIGNPKDENEENNNGTTDTPICKYGDNTYDTNLYLKAIDVTTNNCAISIDLYKDELITKELNKLMENETRKLKNDISLLNLDGTPAINRNVNVIINSTGNGIVGYELQMTASIKTDNETKTIVDYKIDSNGKRVFITNPYKLSK